MQSQRIEWIDSIRGLSAFAVMLLHYFHIALIALFPFFLQSGQVAPPANAHATIIDTLNFYKAYGVGLGLLVDSSRFIYGYYDIGKIGVAVFFLISGFVIPFSLFRSGGSIPNFILNRFFRLYPIYWFSLLVVLLLNISTVPVTWLVISANVTMFQKYIGLPDLNGVAWTLQIELAFYILCIVLFSFKCLKSQAANYVTLALLALGALGLAYIRHQYGIKAPIAMPLGLCLMFMGYIWRKWLLREESISKHSLAAIGALYLALIAIVCAWGYREAFWTYFNTYWIAVAFFVCSTTIMKLRQPWLLNLGKISYSLYLFHALIGKVLLPAIIGLSPALYIQSPYWILLPIVVVMAISIFCSFLTYQFIEKPCIFLGKRFSAPRAESPDSLPTVPAVQ